MFKVHVLGTSSATPAFSRNPSSQVVNYNDRYYLIDCGEGTQMQFQRYRVKYARLDAIFISHLHGDHILGVPGLLSTLSIFERTTTLPIFAPRGLKEIIDVVFKNSETFLRYELDFHAIEDFEPGDVIFKTDRFMVKLLPLTHRTFCRGFHFVEFNKRRKFDFFKAKALEVPNEYFHLLKQENDITLPDGRKVKADEVLLDPDPELSYAYCSDTGYEEALIPHLQKTTLLYHEATFLKNLEKRARETRHSTAAQAATIAAKSGVNHLLIGHYSARYRDLQPLVAEAREVFPATDLAIEGKIYDLKDYV